MLEEAVSEYETDIEVAQIRHAELVACILNSPHASPKTERSLWQVEDFLPEKFRKPKKSYTVEEYMTAWEQFVAGFTAR